MGSYLLFREGHGWRVERFEAVFDHFVCFGELREGEEVAEVLQGVLGALAVERRVVQAEYLNLRTEPGSRGKIIGRVYRGEIIQLLERRKVAGWVAPWGLVESAQTNGRNERGWVYLNRTKSTPG